MSNPIREFSARVELDLIVNGATLPVRQTGGDFVIMSPPFNVKPAIGTLRMKVDEAVTHFKVYLTDGLLPGRDRHPMVIVSSDELVA